MGPRAVSSVVGPVVMTGWPLVVPIVTAMGLVSGRSWGLTYGVCGGSCGEVCELYGPYGHSCGVSYWGHSQGCGLWWVL